jgi:hypothetical protein
MIAETHPVTPEDLVAYQDGELSPDRADSVTAHLQSCRQCQGMGSIVSHASETLAAWTVSPAASNTDFEERLSAHAAKSASAKHPPLRSRLASFGLRHPFLSAALAMAAIIVVGFIAVSTPTPTRRKLQLADEAVSESRSSRTVEEPESANNQVGKLSEALRAVNAQRDALVERMQQDQLSSNLENAPVTPPTELQPMIARTMSLSVVVKDFAASRAALDAVVARHHGYTATLTASTQPNAARSLQTSLRIPTRELNVAVAELKSLGQVENETQDTEEVTQQHADLIARLKNSRETEQRLQDILVQRTGKITDVLAVEQEIARVRGEIEQMESQQKSLEHRVDFATIDLNLSEEYKAKIGPTSPSISTRFHNGLVSGWRSAVESVVGAVLLIVEDGPVAMLWLLVLGPLVWFLRRRWLRIAAVIR